MQLECLFSVMAAVKSKLQNSIVIPMVEASRSTRYGIKRRGENCFSFPILPGTMSRFNMKMYDGNQPQINAPPVGPDQKAETDGDDQELFWVLNDVEEMFGHPVFFT